jgi:dipeptidyl-peptidase-4
MPMVLRARTGALVLCVPLVVVLWQGGGDVRAQGTRADYDRADRLLERSREKVTRVGVRTRWIGEGPDFWYSVIAGPGRLEHFLVDAEGGTKRPLFDAEKLGGALTRLAGREVVPAALPPDAIFVSADGLRLIVRFADKSYAFAIGEEESLAVDDAPGPETPNDERRPARRRRRDARHQGDAPRGGESPDGAWTAAIEGRRIMFRAKSGDESHTVEIDGPAESFVEPGLVWSPDGRFAVALRTTPGEVHKVHAVESSPRDQVQPKLHTWDYLKPGDRIPQTFPVLVDLREWRAIPVDTRDFANPWSLDDIRWSEDSSRFVFSYNQRGHQVLRVISVEAATGTPSVIVNETSPTFLDYAHKRFLWWSRDGSELLWMSERDGWNHLYRVDGRTGAVLNPITRGEWVVRAVERVDPSRRRLWVRVGGVRPGEDPYHVHLATVEFDGSGFTLLTEGDGTHECELSPDGTVFVDTWSRVDHPPVTELRDALTGRKIATLETADWTPLLETGWKPPQRFSAKGRDGKTDIFGVVYRPSNFASDRKYPVVEHIYAGPHGSFVPKRFSYHHPPQTLAELGFVVVQIDGMGTSHRSKAFHDVASRNIGDSGFPDRITWIKSLAAVERAIDLSPGVGIYGGSAGGQSALRALLAHGDFYSTAVADCGCHDNRMDKIWWNELWMGHPVGPHYAEQSNVTQAHRLTGHLLLMVGELDRNVDPASTMQVVDALIRANKDFDLLVFPGGGHGSGSPYAERRRRDFFVRHLLKREPRAE